ncbi:hypothetical protein KL86DPRO_11695 [uncultured delta proteobacterium]|uniref:Ketopantoate reductase N-terminal domain-containing protein n=1 Tax=uncultured delta proteobacterium TaxID=34034 RepID=A0A212JKG1_9DELT|nr:hypothetical protein KL86DPRO_11695 [uncultured delta proteobacterium]
MKIAVLGAGNTGRIMAFDLTQKGAEVRLFTGSPEKAAFMAKNGLVAEGRLEGHVHPALVTTDKGAVNACNSASCLLQKGRPRVRACSRTW